MKKILAGSNKLSPKRTIEIENQQVTTFYTPPLPKEDSPKHQPSLPAAKYPWERRVDAMLKGQVVPINSPLDNLPKRSYERVAFEEKLFVVYCLAAFYNRRQLKKAFKERYSFPLRNAIYHRIIQIIETPLDDLTANEDRELKQQFESARAREEAVLSTLPLTSRKERLRQLHRLFEEIDWAPDKVIITSDSVLDSESGQRLYYRGRPVVDTQTLLIYKKDIPAALAILSSIRTEMLDIEKARGNRPSDDDFRTLRAAQQAAESGAIVLSADIPQPFPQSNFDKLTEQLKKKQQGE